MGSVCVPSYFVLISTIPALASRQMFGLALQVGVIDTGISLNHQDLQNNVNKDCQDFVNNDNNCDEGQIEGNSKGVPPVCTPLPVPHS